MDTSHRASAVICSSCTTHVKDALNEIEKQVGDCCKDICLVYTFIDLRIMMFSVNKRTDSSADTLDPSSKPSSWHATLIVVSVSLKGPLEESQTDPQPPLSKLSRTPIAVLPSSEASPLASLRSPLSAPQRALGTARNSSYR